MSICMFDTKYMEKGFHGKNTSVYMHLIICGGNWVFFHLHHDILNRGGPVYVQFNISQTWGSSKVSFPNICASYRNFFVIYLKGLKALEHLECMSKSWELTQTLL